MGYSGKTVDIDSQFPSENFHIFAIRNKSFPTRVQRSDRSVYKLPDITGSVSLRNRPSKRIQTGRIFKKTTKDVGRTDPKPEQMTSFDLLLLLLYY